MEPILSRQAIAEDADRAAQRYVLTGVEQDCPYVSGTEASREWRASFKRALHNLTAPDAEASA
jgi:hypothetical protein